MLKQKKSKLFRNITHWNFEITKVSVSTKLSKKQAILIQIQVYFIKYGLWQIIVLKLVEYAEKFSRDYRRTILSCCNFLKQMDILRFCFHFCGNFICQFA